MTLTEQVFAQAALLAGELDGRQTNLLRLLCGASASSLTARLREGLTPEDCKADFIAAASLLALAQLNGVDDDAQVEEFKAGDLTVKQGSKNRDAASQCLQRQAELMIAPYLAFFRAVNAKSWQSMESEATLLGEISRGQYAYIGPVGAQVREGDTLTLGDKTYLFRRAELYYYRNQPVYQWGLCVEKGVNDTWASQS